MARRGISINRTARLKGVSEGGGVLGPIRKERGGHDRVASIIDIREG